MKRLVGFALVVTACFSDSPPVSDGPETDGSDAGTGTAGSGVDDGSGTSAPGDDGSGSAEAGVTSVADDTSGASGMCGDGEVQAGEDCDDADDDEQDGCTSACAAGPRALEMMMVPPPGPPIGPKGPLQFSDSCIGGGGPPFVIEELFGRRGGMPPDDLWTSSVSGHCRGLGLSFDGSIASIVVTADTKDLLAHGDLVGLQDDWAVACPPDAVPVGLSGRVFNASHIVAFRLECARLQVDAEQPSGVGVQPMPPTEWTETSQSGEELTVMCPPGAVLVGIRGDVDEGAAAIYRLGPECAVPQVLFGPE